MTSPPRATEELLGVHVVGRSSAPFPDAVAARVRAACVDPPEESSGQICPTAPLDEYERAQHPPVVE